MHPESYFLVDTNVPVKAANMTHWTLITPETPKCMTVLPQAVLRMASLMSAIPGPRDALHIMIEDNNSGHAFEDISPAFFWNIPPVPCRDSFMGH
jgi:hypothetical protein